MKSEPYKKISVLFCFTDCDFYSGGTRSLLDIIDSFIMIESVEVFTLFPDNQGTAIDYLREKDVNIIVGQYSWVIAPINRPWKTKILDFCRQMKTSLKSIYWSYGFKNIIKDLDIDIIYTNTSVIAVGGLITCFLQIPHLWHFRELVDQGLQYEYIFGRRVFYWFANKYASKIIVTSEALYKNYSQVLPGDKLLTIHDDVSPNYINPKNHFDLNKKNLQFLIAGTLCEAKGQYEVLQAVKFLVNRGYDITLNIAGSTDCSYFKILSDYVNENQLNDHVIFHGLVKDMNQLRRNMDIGINASNFEAFGRVTVEGMLSSMVMIGRDCGATSELIQHGETGLLYQPNDINDLVDKIEYLYNNRIEIERLALNGYQYALQEYTVGKCSKSLLDIMWKLRDLKQYSIR